jgi:hypothetical protein
MKERTMPDQGQPHKRRSVFLYSIHEDEVIVDAKNIEIHNHGGNVSAVTHSSGVSVTQTGAVNEFCLAVGRTLKGVEADEQIDDATKRECRAVGEQIDSELKKPAPSGPVVWGLLDKLGRIAGAAKLAELIWNHRSFLEGLLRNFPSS